MFEPSRSAARQMHWAERSGMLAVALGREPRVVSKAITPAAKSVEALARPASSVEEELLRLLARQARRMPIPVFLATTMIAAMAMDYIAHGILVAWLSLVAAVLVLRWYVLGRLPTVDSVPAEKRLYAAVALSALNGVTHGLSLAFFPFLPEFERALQSMLIITFCAGSVATTAGYMPVLLAYLLPTLAPLTILWAASPGVENAGWIHVSTAALSVLMGFIVIALGRDAWRLFRESFAIRVEQVELNRQLEAALQAKTRFLAAASHDLRQPIHTLSLFGAALSLRPLDEATRKIVEHVNTALEALTSQLDSLLDISKLDAGVVVVNRTAVNLCSFLERMHKEFEPAARSKGLGLAVDCAPDALVETDPMLLERIARNLLDNAIKYTDVGSVRVVALRSSEGFVLAVEDTGRGIPDSEQERVFDEFVRGENTDRDRTKGLGLGLSIVKRLAGLLHIRLEMVSTPGRGTRFAVLLPAAGAPAKVAVETASLAEPTLAGHVLVIDDEDSVRQGMQKLLEGMGCRATLTDGTKSAVDAARKAQPDVVVADFELRGGDDGIKAVRAIRELYPNVPAILISGHVGADLLRQAEQAGIALLHKPVRIQTLKRAIAGAVEP